MRRGTIERIVGMSLLLGPLAYALTLQPQVVEVVEVVEVVQIAEGIEAAPTLVPDVIPEIPPAPAPDLDDAAPVVAPAPTPTSEGRLSFAFVTAAGLVLSTEAKTAWGKGRLRDHAGPGEFRAAKRADPKRIPEDLWAQRGRTFDLYGTDGKVCTARLGTLSILAQHDGPSLFELYYGEDGAEPEVDYDTFEAQHHSAAQIRRKVWSTAMDDEYGTAWLVASLSSDTPCKGALWARDRELPAPVILRASDEPSALTQQRLAQHEASEALAQTRRDYIAWYENELTDEIREDTETWEALVGEYPAHVRTWLDAQGRATFVELDFGDEGGWCGEGFDSSIASLDRVIDGRFEPTEHPRAPLMIFDADLDGRYEMLFADDTHGGASLLMSESMATDWDINQVFFCPC